MKVEYAHSVSLQHKDDQPTVWFVVTLFLKQGSDGRFSVVRDRAPGFFFTEEEAVECITKNRGDIYECGYYNHALVQPMKAGLYYHLYRQNRWFRAEWSSRDAHPERESYVVTELSEPPKGLERICGFVVG